MNIQKLTFLKQIALTCVSMLLLATVGAAQVQDQFASEFNAIGIGNGDPWPAWCDSICDSWEGNGDNNGRPCWEVLNDPNAPQEERDACCGIKDLYCNNPYGPDCDSNKCPSMGGCDNNLWCDPEN